MEMARQDVVGGSYLRAWDGAVLLWSCSGLGHGRRVDSHGHCCRCDERRGREGAERDRGRAAVMAVA